MFSLKVCGVSRDHMHVGVLQWALLTFCEHRMKTSVVERDRREREAVPEIKR